MVGDVHLQDSNYYQGRVPAFLMLVASGPAFNLGETTCLGRPPVSSIPRGVDKDDSPPASAGCLLVASSPLDEVETGFVPMFDGKTLDGWKQVGGIAYSVEGE